MGGDANGMPRDDLVSLLLERPLGSIGPRKRRQEKRAFKKTGGLNRMSSGKKDGGETGQAADPAGEERVKIPIPNVLPMVMRHYQNGNLDQAGQISRKVLQVEARSNYRPVLGKRAGLKRRLQGALRPLLFDVLAENAR